MPLFIDIGCNTDTQLPVSVSVQTEKTETVNRYTQTERKKKSVHKAIQTDSQMHPLCIHRVPDQANEVSPQLSSGLAESHEFSEVESETSSGSQSENWDPQASSFSSAESECEKEIPPHFERKFLVFESCLLQLFAICSVCLGPCIDISTSLVGSMVQVEASCLQGHVRKWRSQPLIGDMPLGNFVIAASTLLSGCSPAKILLLFHNMQTPSFTERTYHRIQKLYLIPSILEHWKSVQQQLLRSSQGIRTLGGDARMDSPGHTAKYGSYSLMNLESNKIISVNTLQSNEVGGSYHMELEGLKRCLDEVKAAGINFSTLVTDRHAGVKKYMRECHSDKNHRFDVFHVAKSIARKVEEIGKKRTTAVVNEWVPSIKNHVYWCASTSKDSPQLIKEKWLSLFNHIINKHEGHDGQLFKCCEHGPMEREWLIKGKAAYKELKDKLTKTQLLNDIAKLSPVEQTSHLESFHNIVLHFAPKHTHFHFQAMTARVLLAAIHFNENTGRQQLETKDGEKRWQISYIKYKQTGVVKPIKSKSTYEYAKIIMEKAVQRRKELITYAQAGDCHDLIKSPDPLSAGHKKVSKPELVSQHISRFSKTSCAGPTEEQNNQVQNKKPLHRKRKKANNANAREVKKLKI
ncbi:uncharacterized protein LOC135683252 [Rhopilema esculentum]